MANDSDFGLSGAVFAPTLEEATRHRPTAEDRAGVGERRQEFSACRRSAVSGSPGSGRELGPHGLAEYFELMALHLPADA